MKIIKKLAVSLLITTAANLSLMAAPGPSGGGPQGFGSAPSPQGPSMQGGERVMPGGDRAMNGGREQMPDMPPPPAPDLQKPEERGKDADGMFYYRGTRTVNSDAPFIVQNINPDFSKDNLVTMEIHFSQNINPASVNNSSILIDGKEIPEKTQFSFNKKGDTIRLTIPSTQNDFTITVQDIKSYRGTVLLPSEIKISTDKKEE